MNKHLIAGLTLAAALAAAPAAKALPLIDIGVGIGPLTIEDDDSAAIAASGTVDVNIPVLPLMGVQGHIVQTLQDGEFDTGFGTVDYSGNQLGAFLTVTTPTPGIKVKGKVGMMRSDFEFNGTSGDTSSDLAFGAAVRLSSWEIALTRTMVDDDMGERNIDLLTLSYVF